MMPLAGIRAQGYVDQEAVAPILESQMGDVATLKPVTWHSYTMNVGKGGTKAAFSRLAAHLDSLPGAQVGHRLEIVELTNRIRSKYFIQRKTLLIPDAFPEDFRCYSPYPFEYPQADSLPKLLIIDKFTQTFGAYERGKLVRWGLVSSGREDDLTPPGRYNFNWKAEYRESTEAPEGEVWQMRWVFDFYAEKGIHVHQYSLPIGQPASHGCVRMTEADALWNFNWASQWSTAGGKVKQNGTPVIVTNYNPLKVAHWQLDSDGKVYSLVGLPADLMTIPPGSPNQKAVPWASNH